jgi:hypothetical protein
MSCCNDCIEKVVYGCPLEITLAKVPTTEDVKVYFRHPATGRIDVYPATPEIDGTVAIFPPGLSYGVAYEVWISTDVEPLPLNGTGKLCITFTQFPAKIHDEDAD